MIVLLFFLSFLFEFLLIVNSGNKQIIRIFAFIGAGLLVASLPLLVIPSTSLPLVLLLLISCVRVVTFARKIANRMKPSELRRRSMQTFIYTTTASVFLLLYIVYFDDSFSITVDMVIYTQFAVALCLGLSVLLARTIYRYRPTKQAPEILPTVTVCIPARNETNDLPKCIQSALASTYPKLEIIVLDDCSHDKTPEIIKLFAHDGVRFVNGKEPRDDWLAKNAAYDRLADEAKGEILLFIGVDVRLQPDSVMELVKQLDGDDMISVLPRRDKGHESAVFIQPLRYWWELGLWRFSSGKPPVLSTCWAIRAETLAKLGTFESVKKAVEPEAVFAQKLFQDKKYAFLVANDVVAIESVKAPKEQYDTALRKRYAQLRRRPELVLAVILFEAVFVLLPFVFVVWSVYVQESKLLILSAFTVLVLTLSNIEVYKLSLRRLWLLGLVSLPALVLADWVLLLRSMYAYEFGKVIWKERNICLPLLTVEKSLPKLD